MERKNKPELVYSTKPSKDQLKTLKEKREKTVNDKKTVFK